MHAHTKRTPFFSPVLAILLLGVFGAVLLAGCAQLGMATPDTFNKRIAAGYALVQTVADSATAAVQAGKLSKTDAQNVVTTGNAALAGLDVARTVYAGTCPAGSPPTCTAPAADSKLAATLTVLTALQAYLATQTTTGGK